MRIYPKALDLGDQEGFATKSDLFERAELGRGMSNLVSVVEDPLVIAFDGQWGSGKTTFLKMWAGELRKIGHPVIFFDAFENDYVEDAFAALARELIQLAEEAKPQNTKLVQSFKEKATDLGALLLRGSAKIGTKIAIRAATAGLASADDMKEFGEIISEQAEDIAQTYMEQILDQPRKQKEIAEIFRRSLADLPSLLSPPEQKERQKPLVFIVDELDRCKPVFALALLERLKHFMSVPNIHFVLGVHLSQLESSVKFAYGHSIDARAYLQKFINLTVIGADSASETSTKNLEKYANHLVKELGISREGSRHLEIAISTIIRITRCHQFGFRTLERAFTMLSLASSFTPSDRLFLGPIVGGLVMMKLLRPDLFRKAKLGSLSFQDAKEFLQFDNNPDNSQRNHKEEQWWIYILNNEIPPNLTEAIDHITFNYSFHNPRDILDFTANKILDRLLPI